MRSHDLRIRIDKPNGSSLTVEPLEDGRVHVYIEDRHCSGMGISLTDEETRALESFLAGRRALLEDDA